MIIIYDHKFMVIIKGWESITNSVQCMDSLPQHSILGYLHFVGRCMLSLSCYSSALILLSIRHFYVWLIKPINNRWAWRMVLEEGGGTRRTEANTQGIAMTTLRAATLRQCHTENQWGLKYLPHTYHAKRDGQGRVNSVKLPNSEKQTCNDI